MSTPKFDFSQALSGHNEDVRALASSDAGSGWIYTASRDCTIKGWALSSNGAYTEAFTLAGHADYVIALAVFPAGVSTDVPGKALLSGSRDKTAKIWDLDAKEAVRTLTGHKWAVNGVGVLPGGEVATGELDGTLRVWKAGKTIRTLSEHSGAILCVLILPNEDILTGSQDQTIMQWSGNHAHTTYKGHTDSVRGLCNMPGVGFVSASNDTTLRVWTLGGDTVAELAGHTALVYACAATDQGLIVSGSEDNTFKLWNGAGTCLQTVELPGCVWAVTFTANGDVVAGAADGCAYIFSAAQERQDPIEGERLQARVAEKKANAAPTEGIPEENIKPESVLLAPGTSDNQTILVRQNGKVYAHTWSASACEWQNLGEASHKDFGDTLEKPKVWHDGKEWDFMIDVDTEGGALKLPLNRGEDPYDVADRFLQKHNLPASYMQQVADFVAQTLGDTAPASGNPDPLTGGISYREPNSTPAAPSVAATSSGLVYTPHREYQLFEAAPAVDKVAAKLRKLSAAVPADSQLSEQDAAPGGGLDQLLDVAATGRGALAGDIIDALGKLARWPSEQLFPVLDIFRLLVLNASHARLLSYDAGELTADNPGLGGMLARGLSASAPAPSKLMAHRLACNCCAHPQLRSWLWARTGALFDAVADAAVGSNKAGRAALATLLLDYGAAVHRGEASGDDEHRVRALSMLCEVLASAPADEHDTQFRALLAAATVAHGHAASSEMARDLGFVEQAQQAAASAGAPEKLRAVAQDVQHLLKH